MLLYEDVNRTALHIGPHSVWLGTRLTARWSEMVTFFLCHWVGILLNSCNSVLLLVLYILVLSRSGKQPLSGSVPSGSGSIFTFLSWTSAVVDWKAGVEVKSTLLLRIVFFFSTSTPAWENQPSPCDLCRCSARSNFAFHLTIISADNREWWTVRVLTVPRAKCKQSNVYVQGSTTRVV